MVMVEPGRDESGRVGQGRVGSGRSGWSGTGRDGSGRVGPVQVRSGQVRSGSGEIPPSAVRQRLRGPSMQHVRCRWRQGGGGGSGVSRWRAARHPMKHNRVSRGSAAISGGHSIGGGKYSSVQPTGSGGRGGIAVAKLTRREAIFSWNLNCDIGGKS